MIVSHIKEAPPEYWRPGVETRMTVSAQTGATALCMFEQWVAPGHGAPTHRHLVEEVLSVREGEADMWIDDHHATLTAGQCLVIPAGARHGFSNSGKGTLHIQAVLAAPIFEAIPDGATDSVRRWDTAGEARPK
jgi:mannose-6-phosphate isomerase-like protein (cupin superfamily)